MSEIGADQRTSRRARTVWRFRLLACCLALGALCFWQQPGLISTDTKLDLVVDPSALLARALHLWNPDAAFGQLQNQANGYLFPMGPFFVLGDLLGAPGWAVQRAWWSVILVVAFLGVVRLTSVMGVGNPWSRVIAGFAYALAPRLVATMGAVSIEAWPAAVAPWVLVPVVLASRGGSARRNAAFSALAVLCIGGVNAAATAIAVIPAALWLVLTPGWCHRWRFAAWWFGCLAAVTVWWSVPVVLLGGYSPPFLDWIETAATTTGFTSLVETFRGVDHWLSYFVQGGRPIWPGAWLLVSDSALIVDTAVVAALGLAGIAMRGIPARRFLVCGVVLGLGLLTMGHVGTAVTGPYADQLRSLLDGPLVPFRNVHKFDLVLRLPLVIGLAYLLSAIRFPAVSRTFVTAASAGIAMVAILGTAAPALTGHVPQQGAFAKIPDHWEQTADWLNDQSATGRALVVPGAGTGLYEWGYSRDEPLQALSQRPWAVRDGVPLSSAGNIRLLDAIEANLAAGEGGQGVVEALTRSGVRYLVVRNDLDRRSAGATRPILVHQAIANMPGVRWVQSFGTAFGSYETATATTDSGLDPPFSGIDIFEIDQPDDLRVHVYPLTGTLRMSGGPESLLPVGDAGLLVGRAAFVAGDGDGVADPSPLPVVTDGLRRRAVWFGAGSDRTTEVLRAGEAGPFERVARDYLPVDDPDRETVAVVRGVADVRASSSASNPRSIGIRGAEYSPWAALDGDIYTAWSSGDTRSAVGQWLEVRLNSPVDVNAIGLIMLDRGPVLARATEVAVMTDNGTRVTALEPGPTAQQIPTAPGPTTVVRVTVSDVEPGRVRTAGIRELHIPGVEVRRSLRTAPVEPSDLGGPQRPEAVVLSVAEGARSECVTYGVTQRCSTALGRGGEEDAALARQLTLESGGSYVVTAYGRPRPSAELDALIPTAPGAIRATASSRAVVDPRGRPQAAADRDLGTGWVAAPDDLEPRLDLSWDETRDVRGVRVTTEIGLAASVPTRVRLSTGSASVEAAVDRAGFAYFPAPVSTSELSVTILQSEPKIDRDPIFGAPTTLPPGISELRVLGADDLRQPVDEEASTGQFCGQGPALSIDGRTVPTEVVGQVGDFINGRSVEIRACGDQDTQYLARGERRIVLEAGSVTRPDSVVLQPARGVPAIGAHSAATVVRWETTRRSVTVGARTEPVLLVIPENANAGWRATLDGRVLSSVRHDGWSQGYVVPAGPSGTVELEYVPDRQYRAALAAAVPGSLGVIAMAAWPARTAMRRKHAAPRRFRRRAWRRAAGLIVSTAALWLLGGGDGLTAAAIGLVIGIVMWRWPSRRRMLPVLVGGAAVLAGMFAAAHPWPDSAPGALSWPAQFLVLVAVALTLMPTAVRVALGRNEIATSAAQAARRTGS